ncbi:Uncharacterized conserved protein, DUF885 familyt [Altererythrobacter xiamenensis]|uniref:Uncharacterized conserved protein, DUF885 familyt n=1 Tax=Altererythrobacter xiamenensis TaxID=1316679 RepID=A0A1Y6EIY9_9SPHN|nr:DUF885 domain-containing protein [Altererythrobacter xiamenensis]SMQ61161.1 Uncharacterized conserved protein, DUF885 familyt [Altererythrobacter xiamenensis]
MNDIPTNFTRRQALAGLGGVSALALLPGCAQQAGLGAAAPVTLTPDEMLDQIAWALLEHEPERATSLGVDTGEHADLRSRLTDKTPEGVAAYAASLRWGLEQARSYPKEGLTDEQRTSFDVIESGYSLALDGMALPYGDIPVGSWRTAPYVVIQNVGAYLDLPRFMDSIHPLRDTDDAEAYIARIEAIPGVLAGELERMKSARAMGVVPPDFLIAKATGQMRTTLLDAMEGGTLVAPLEKADTTVDPDGSYARRAQEIVTTQIAPGFEAQLAELFAQQKVATGEPGMYARPRGEEWYAWALRSSTTTTLSPDEVHQQGLEELDALHARMDPILREIGFTSGTVGERMQALGADPRYQFAEGDPGRAEIMSFIEERIDWIKAQMPRAFNTLVDPNLEVRRIPPAEEVGAPGAYGGAGSKDGTIPGRFWINLRTTDLHRKYDLADLTYHETIPGHVWEGEYSNRLPLIRSILAFNPFSEGWALYGEQLADELGAYDDYKVGRLGYLQSLAFRACRMVVDTGLHAKGWSRDKAVDFFVTRNGSKRAEVEGEVDRYCSWPGQATGYKLGHSRIVDQRARAQRELGGAYDFKAFNDAVVLGGNVPMDVLEKNVGRYIAANSP